MRRRRLLVAGLAATGLISGTLAGPLALAGHDTSTPCGTKSSHKSSDVVVTPDATGTGVILYADDGRYAGIHGDNGYVQVDQSGFHYGQRGDNGQWSQWAAVGPGHGVCSHAT